MSIPAQHEPTSGSPLEGVDPNLDPADFDLDAWISAVDRPEDDVPIYNPDPAWDARVAAARAEFDRLDAALVAATRAEENDEERSILDEGSASLRAQLTVARDRLLELRDERDGAALIVRVRQMLPDDFLHAIEAARGADAPKEEHGAWAIAAGIVSMTAPGPDGSRRPVRPFTGPQLMALASRDASGREAFDAISRKIDSISARPTVPTWPGSSTSRGTGTSSAR